MSEKLVFVFPGQGGQWIGMGRELIETEPAFRDAIEKCDQIIEKNFKWSVLELLQSDEMSSNLDDIGFVQPTLFSIQVALAELWK